MSRVFWEVIFVNRELLSVVYELGADILSSDGMKSEKNFIHHGDFSCFDHSLRVAAASVYIAVKFGISVDMRSLVRGALLHDYFLYDWHENDPSHRLHGFHHAKRALMNAEHDFCLNNIEKEIIIRHMFPLNITPPRYAESRIVCLADKLCAAGEVAVNYKNRMIKILTA